MTTHDGESDDLDGGPPTVLLAALGAALLIAVGLIAGFASLGGDDSADSAPERPTGVTTTTADERVLLTVSVDGDGFGRVQIEPSDVSCNASCEYKFTAGRRVVATVEPSPGSTFEGWGDACSGDGRCSFVMDRPRNLSATFAEEPASDALCDDSLPAEEQDACATDQADDLADPDAPPPPPREPGPDCIDNIDNDDDGLTDTEQDPDCDATGSEAGTAAPPSSPTSPPPPPAATPNQCTDGEDNDRDGLTDRAQDPDCEKGRSESG
ncbi:MAG: hypothetical protein Q8K79_15750 [Solirubrobacteraceae bacterium]|nr:hypothetical protein [Solirubrobacteraceae bacterium]